MSHFQGVKYSFILEIYWCDCYTVELDLEYVDMFFALWGNL